MRLLLVCLKIVGGLGQAAGPVADSCNAYAAAYARTLGTARRHLGPMSLKKSAPVLTRPLRRPAMPIGLAPCCSTGLQHRSTSLAAEKGLSVERGLQRDGHS